MEKLTFKEIQQLEIDIKKLEQALMLLKETTGSEGDIFSLMFISRKVSADNLQKAIEVSKRIYDKQKEKCEAHILLQ